jgi:hypothetical protein
LFNVSKLEDGKSTGVRCASAADEMAAILTGLRYLPRNMRKNANVPEGMA